MAKTKQNTKAAPSPTIDEWKRERRKDGSAGPVPYEVLHRWAADSGMSVSDVHFHYNTLEWGGAGRKHSGPSGFGWYGSNPWGFDEDNPWDEWLDRRYRRNYYRRQVPNAPREDGLLHDDEVPHYIVQKGMPRAFTYAVGLGTGIKVGKSGTGDGDLVVQLSGRFGAYKSTHAVEVIGVNNHFLKDVNAAEANLLKELAPFKLDFGEEIFQDCPDVRNVLWEWFGGAWHQPKLLETLEERSAYWHDISSESPFHNLKGKSHVHAFDWRDYVRLVEEIELCQTALSPEVYELFEAIVIEQKPDFGESEGDDLLLELLNIYLPKEESIYPNARRKLHDFLGW
jgi:hypothetical protein